jgi:Kef-type K+ transport system membrane component KefB
MDFGILFIFGAGAFGGILGASIFQRLKIPQVVGYIAIGIIIGNSGMGIVTHEDILDLRIFNLFALGLIGFLVGGEIHADTFKRYRKQFTSILIGEGMGAFLIVTAVITAVLWYLLHDFVPAVAAGLVFGAIASATDPASTMDVLWEYRARGVVTTTIIAVIALDDALAMTLYGFSTSIAQFCMGGGQSFASTALKIGIEVGGAVVFGIVLGYFLNVIVRWLPQKEKMLVLALGIILLAIAVAEKISMDIILVTMALGVTLTNLAPRRSKEVFAIVRTFSNPIYVIFFVLVGARLSIGEIPTWLWVIIVLYVLGRSAGKMGGSYLGAHYASAPRVVQRYTGMALFAQGGIAVGLSIMASQHLQHVALTATMSLGDAVIFGVAASTLVVQLIGPPLVKLSVRLAGEAGRNITEEDVISSWCVENAMEKKALVIGEHELLSRVFEMFAEHEKRAYAVVDRGKRISGIITLQRLKDIIASQETWDWLLASDVMIPVREKVYPGTPLAEALSLMRQLKYDQIPVVSRPGDDTAVGMLDLNEIQWLVDEEVLRRQRAVPLS